MPDIFARVKHIYGSEADWAANDIVLLAGEIAFANVGGSIQGKVGNGVDTWSALPYTVGTAAVPLSGTIPGQQITGQLTFENVTIDKEFTVGIQPGGGIDDFMIQASGGTNVDVAKIYVKTDQGQWSFDPDGKITGPDVTYAPGDELKLANVQYVDDSVAGIVSANYIPLIGNEGTGFPVTGRIEFYNATIDKTYHVGIVEGVQNQFVIAGAGAEEATSDIIIQPNGYEFEFNVAGRLILPSISYGPTDSLAAVTKAFVDELRQDIIDAGVSIPAPVV